MDVFGIIQLAGLAAFIFPFISKTALLKAKGVKAFRLGRDKNGIRKYVEVLFVFVFILWSVEIVFHSTGMAANIFPWFVYIRLFDTLWLKICGCVLIASGAVSAVLSLISSGDSWRVGVDDVNTGAMVTSGMFSWSRNPLYTALNIMSAGYFLVNGDVFFLCSMIVIAAMFHYQIIQEEKSLEAKYKEAYLEYKKKVRRYI
jgi:protein-S-isoprenylcysteine O-methyltransferase Ste14